MPVKIVFCGGGTGGPITPLLGLIDELERQLRMKGMLKRNANGQTSVGLLESEKQSELAVLWLGSGEGPESWLVGDKKVIFKKILSGKWRRYWDIRNITDIGRIFLAFWQSLFILITERPKAVVSAGSFVSVPVTWAAWLLKVPVLIHQQDARPGLANRLAAPFARVVTVAFEKSLADYGNKAVWTGNPVRREFTDIKITPTEAKQKLGLTSKKPVVLVMGGGGGAQAINELAVGAIDELSSFCQVLHITGPGKYGEENISLAQANPNYRFFEFLDTFGMIKAFAAADVVVCRAGMATLTEISFLGKPAILIPIPDSHQEENARVFDERAAAIVLNQKGLMTYEFAANIREIIKNDVMRHHLVDNIQTIIRSTAAAEIAGLVMKLSGI